MCSKAKKIFLYVYKRTRATPKWQAMLERDKGALVEDVKALLTAIEEMREEQAQMLVEKDDEAEHMEEEVINEIYRT